MYVYVPKDMYVYLMCPETRGGHKRILDPLELELELQAIVSCHVVPGTEPRFSARASSALNN